MKLLRVLSLCMVLCLLFTLGAAAQRTIRSVTVVFNTTDDDKDNDTYLRCQLVTPDNHWFATAEGQFGRFSDNSSFPLGLNLGAPYYPESLLNQSIMLVQIFPNGNDTWHFGWSVIVTFSDGTQRTAWGSGNLNQSSNFFRLTIF